MPSSVLSRCATSNCLECGWDLGRLIPYAMGPTGPQLVCLGCWWELGYTRYFHWNPFDGELGQLERLWREFDEHRSATRSTGQNQGRR